MRVLVYANSYPGSFGLNIAVTLEAMGHDVMTVDESPFHRHFNRYWAPFWSLVPKAFPGIEARRQQGLVETIERFEPDLVLLNHNSMLPEVVARIRKRSKAKLAVWYPDHMCNFGRQYLLASDLDAWFFKDPYMVDTFRAKLGINAHYLPQACNPRWHRRVELTESDRRKYGCDLTVASNMYYYRARMLEHFKDYDLKIWGKSYPRWLHSPLRAHYPDIYVAGEEKAKAFNAAKIILNTMHYGEIDGVNLRVFEAAGCGGFQIADWKPTIATLFEPDREIVTFHTLAELKEKVHYYLARPEERRRIADRAYARAHRDHTYEIRLARMMDILGLSSQSPSPVAVGAPLNAG
jgi:spore maturation protein CgeB